MKHPEFELYDMKADPWEINNLAGKPEYAEKVKRMHKELKAEMAKLDDSFTPEIVLSEKKRESAEGNTAKTSKTKKNKK